MRCAREPSMLAIPRRGRRLDAHVYRRRRRPGEILSLRATVRANCLACSGWQTREVAACTSQGCWCWPWRMPGPPSLEGEDVRLIAGQYYDPTQERTGNPAELPAASAGTAETRPGAAQHPPKVVGHHPPPLRPSAARKTRSSAASPENLQTGGRRHQQG